MNVTVDSLRNLAANQSIMFNTKSESIEKAKAYHSIGVHFGTAASKARNQATLQAIKQAIVSDPRYPNVRAQAQISSSQARLSSVPLTALLLCRRFVRLLQNKCRIIGKPPSNEFFV